MAFEPYADPRDVELEEHVYEVLRGRCQNLHVQVKGGVVTLSGIAEDYGDKRAIHTTVQMMGGVKQVINKIRVISLEDEIDSSGNI